MRRVMIVFAGGGLGASARAALIDAVGSWQHLPLPILMANLVGAFLLGIVYVLADEVELLRGETRLFLAIGVLGGFTTFSSFTWGTDLILAQQRVATALIYVCASVGGGLLAVALGLVAGREMVLQIERMARYTLSRLELGRANRSAREDIGSIEAEDREESA